MVWADKVKSCVNWCEGDREKLVQLRAWLDAECDDMIENLAERLIKTNGAQSMMKNARFTQRLHDVLREWLDGLFEAPFDNGGAEKRRSLGTKLADVGLTFEDVMLLEGMTRQRLFTLAQERFDEHSLEPLSMMHALSKAMMYHRGLVYSGYLDLHDEELEHALLDRFLTITGFSPTLYESLVEAWRWNQSRIGHT